MHVIIHARRIASNFAGRIASFKFYTGKSGHVALADQLAARARPRTGLRIGKGHVARAQIVADQLQGHKSGAKYY